MMLLVAAILTVLTIVVTLLRTVVSDGYGTRPPPRSHRDVVAVDNHGMPTKYLR